jgi:hypothetical protein
MLLVALGTLSCASPDVRWHADKRFTEAERASIQDGFAWLENASQHDMGGIAFDYEVTSADALPHTIRRERGPYGEHGATGLCSGQTIYLDVTETGLYIDGLAAHELGHCELGLKDDFESVGIMRRLSPKAWTEREQAQYEHR